MKGNKTMIRLRLLGLFTLMSLALALAQALIAPAAVFASTAAPIAVPAPLEVPPGVVFLFKSHAVGIQMYECQNGQWAFRAPSALLIDPDHHRPTAIHYGGIDRGMTPGPWWESMRDRSRIRGGNAISAPSTNPNSIPQLRLEVLEHQGSGVFTKASYIQRLDTIGGVGPTGACTTGARRPVPYSADYYFYGNP